MYGRCVIATPASVFRVTTQSRQHYYTVFQYYCTVSSALLHSPSVLLHSLVSITTRSRQHYCTFSSALLHSLIIITAHSRQHYYTVSSALRHSLVSITTQSRQHYNTASSSLLHIFVCITAQFRQYYYITQKMRKSQLFPGHEALNPGMRVFFQKSCAESYYTWVTSRGIFVVTFAHIFKRTIFDPG